MLRTTFRAKLLAILGAAILSLLAVLAVSAATSVEHGVELNNVQRRVVPKAELGPRIEAAMEHLTRSMQDAVAAQDAPALDAAIEHKTQLFDLITRAEPALEPSSAAALRWAVQDYYDTARAVSQRMIAGEAGEALVGDVTRMQAQQARAFALIKKTTNLGHDELSGAFASVRRASERGDRLRIGAAAIGTLLVGLFAWWGARGLLQTLGNLMTGLSRFGTGDFSTPIPVVSQDELGLVAQEANRMAASLQRIAEEREREDWLKSGLSGLADELRGELLPAVVAERSLTYLAARVQAAVGALYILDDDGSLRLQASYAGGGLVQNAALSPQFKPGEGLIGQALLSGELTTIEQVPPDYIKIKSGLGDTTPQQLLILPLVHAGRQAGVLELGMLQAAEPRALELLRAVLPSLVIAIDAARAGAARNRLLVETQAQAERLGVQEEELRLNNQELLAQQDELRRANEELDQQRGELSQQNAELEHARVVLQERADELKRVSSYKSEFLANMSHELRTPLNSMLLLSQLLSENDGGNLTQKQVEHLRTVHAAGQDLLGLINEVLDLSKIEAGRQDVNLESVEPQHFVRFARRLFEASASQKGITLAGEVEPDCPPLLVTDRQRVERILVNLLGNALKFTERGQITLRIGRPAANLLAVVPGAAIAFTVADSGIGIPDSARERVFAPFEQVKGPGQAQAGTGLGLPIARESARLLGGELLLVETSERGSTFVCVLPERAQPVTTMAAAGAPVRKVEDDAATLGRDEPHLLLIEDDAVLAEQLVELAHARRIKVVVASSGQEGLRIARRGKTLGIVLDVNLPDVEGWSVMERLKHDQATRDIPVHFVSGVDAPQRGLALGAVGYLVKPASFAELSRVVRTLVPDQQGARKILIVEDNADQGGSVRELLEREGFAATHVQTAKAALQALERGSFGCIVLDLGLPDMDGLAVLQTLRARPELGAPRVVIHTGRELSKQETRELEAYAEAVVLKDGSSAERLLEEIRLFIRHVSEKSPLAPAPPPARVDVSLRGIKLLLAEDDMRTVYSLSALLRSKGADVVTAETGREALEALSKHPDIRGVLMDVMMPEMDGYEAMRQLRRDDRFSKLPVIALTAKAMKGERERCLDAGASDYLPKPVDGEALLTALRSWLSPGAS